MSPVPPQTSHDLEDFAEVLEWLDSSGFEFAVIGGQAVSAYASLLDETVHSLDLDLYVSPPTLREMMAQAREFGLQIVKRPKPRHLPVAVFALRDLEINALTESAGLLPPEVITRTARLFSVSRLGERQIPIADPFDLLSNKLSVAREKDLPHIAILEYFVEREAIEAFSNESQPRLRLAPVRRLLEVRNRVTLPEHLAGKLLDKARIPSDFRFLASCVPMKQQADRLTASCPDEALRRQLEKIIRSREHSLVD